MSYNFLQDYLQTYYKFFTSFLHKYYALLTTLLHTSYALLTSFFWIHSNSLQTNKQMSHELFSNFLKNVFKIFFKDVANFLQTS